MLQRPRRLRASAAIRSLVAETQISVNDFIVPVFVDATKGTKAPIASMPNYYRYSLDLIGAEAKAIADLGLKSILLFVKEEDHRKDNTGAAACDPDGLMHRAIKEIKNAAPELLLMTDVALDPYSTYGHDGLVENGKIVNDPTVAVLALPLRVLAASAAAAAAAPACATPSLSSTNEVGRRCGGAPCMPPPPGCMP